MSTNGDEGREAAEEDLRARPYDGRVGRRHLVCFLVFLIVLICYADRTNIGIVLAQEHFDGIPKEDKGSILSAFFVGYMCTQVIGGFLARRWGGKPTLLLAAVIWTTFDVLTPAAASLGIGPLIAVRILMGFGEGMMFPTQHALTAFWVPKSERGLLVLFMTSGQDIGSMLASLVSPILAQVGAWCVFTAWGSVALIWFMLYAALGASAPEVSAACLRTGEAGFIQQNRGVGPFWEAQRQIGPLCPWRFLLEPCLWAIYVAHMGVNYSWYVILSWMPTFLHGLYGLDLAASPWSLAFPYLASWFGAMSAGFVSDMLVARGMRTRHVRKVMQALGACGSAFFLQLAARADGAGWASIWLSIAIYFGRIQTAGYWVNMVDVCPESAATVMGISNTFATIPGIVGQPITQAILNHGGGDRDWQAWATVFGVGGAVAVLAAVVFAALADDVPLEGSSQPGDAACAGPPPTLVAAGDGGALEESRCTDRTHLKGRA